jgi:Protein of unknown function (DUF2917)
MKDFSQSMATRTVDLDHTQLLILEDARGSRVKVIYGGVWLTSEGDSRDHFARRGQELTVGTGGRTIVAPQGRTRIEVQETMRTAWLRAIGTALRRGPMFAPARVVRA